MGRPDVVMNLGQGPEHHPAPTSTGRRRPQKILRRVQRNRSSGSSSNSAADEEVGQETEDSVAAEYKAQAATLQEIKTELWEVDDIVDRRTSERKFVAHDPKRLPAKAPQELKELSTETYGKWVLVLRRVYSKDDVLRKVRLDIKSPLILQILQEVIIEDQATLVTEGSISWPNDKLFRYMRQIHEAAAARGSLAVKHVEVLLDLVRFQYAERISLIEKLFPKGTSTFDILREAFYPGEIIVQGKSASPRAYRITKAYYHQGEETKQLRISAVYLDYQGYEFGTIEKTFLIVSFKGFEFIADFEVFPLKFHPNRDVVKTFLLERGRKFAELKGKQHRTYAGPVDRVEVYRARGSNLKLADSDEDLEISSDIIIDTATYNRLHGHDSIRVESIADELIDGELTDIHLMICTDRIPFFSLKDKEWHKGNVMNIQDKVFNENIFAQLVLPEGTKQLVRALVRNHAKGSGFDDFVKGKGRGLVILLHGPPAVGNTMTAEAVAEFTHRPLYTVTCGELGTSAPELESSLSRILDIATAFNAVLLLDEADIFLERRTPNDVTRNALVSIFLRLLEYYKGMLFLTTNRIRNFDDAFHSRIHITLGYENCDAATREKIWRNFETMVEGGLGLKDVEFAELASWELNGRQIKNALSSAIALAADREDIVRMSDLRIVLEISRLSKAALE